MQVYPNPERTVAAAIATAKRVGGTHVQTSGGKYTLDEWAALWTETTSDKEENFYRDAHQSPKVNKDGRIGEIIVGYALMKSASVFPVFKETPAKGG